MNLKLKFLTAAAGLALASMGGSATAAAFSWYSPITAFEDDNLEQVIDVNGDGILNAGDRLRAVAEWPKETNVIGGGSTNLNANGTEVTGISEIEVASVSDTGFYTFKPSATFEAVYGAGAMVAVFLDTNVLPPNGDVDLTAPTCDSTAACEAAVTNAGDAPASTVWFTAGIAQNTADFWASQSQTNAPTVIGSLTSIPASSKVGVANYGLSVFTNNTGQTFGLQFNPFANLGAGGFTQVIGSGDVLGGQGLTNGYEARSDFDFQLRLVPEPATLGLLGAALVAFAGLRRRQA